MGKWWVVLETKLEKTIVCMGRWVVWGNAKGTCAIDNTTRCVW